jgi:hypothetical protein
MDPVKCKLVRLWTKGKLHDRDVYRGTLLPPMALSVGISQLPTVNQCFYMARSGDDVLRTSTVTDVQVRSEESGMVYVFRTQNSKYKLEVGNGLR